MGLSYQDTMSLDYSTHEGSWVGMKVLKPGL